MRRSIKSLLISVIIVFLFIGHYIVLPNQEKEETKGALIKGILMSIDNTPMKGVKFFLLKVPFKTEDLKNKKKRKKLFKKAVFLPLVDQTLTDDEGQFVFKGVSIGNYFISAAITDKSVEPGSDYVKSGKNNLIIIVEGENDKFDLKIQSGKDLRSVDN